MIETIDIVKSFDGIQVLDQQKDIDECIDIARESIESGKAWKALQKFVEINS